MRMRYCSLLLALVFALVLIMPGPGGAEGFTPDMPQPAPSPQRAVEQAWKRVQDAGSYRFLSTADQTMIPRPVPEMIGQSSVHLTLENDGAVLLPGHAYLDLRVAGAGREQSATLLRDGNESFLWQDGKLEPVDDTLSATALSADMLGYLAAAEQVVLLTAPEGHPELIRYGFHVNGERFEAYVRQQALDMLEAEPGAPDGLNLRPSPALQGLSGQGELWVNQAGLPVRQVLDVELPEANEYYGVRLRLVVDLLAFGQIETLPKAVRGPDGAWRMEGALPPHTGPSLARSSIAKASLTSSSDRQAVPAMDNTSTSVPSVAQHALPLGTLPLAVPTSTLALLGLAVATILSVRYYLANPRRFYVVLIIALIPTMVFTPLLQAGQLLTYMDGQARAQEARRESTPDLLRALGLQPEAVPTEEPEPSEAPADAPTPRTAVRESVAPAAAPRDHEISVMRPSSIQMLDAVQEPSMPLRCGEGEPGVDTDGDGLDDTDELCLGTSTHMADTDQDGIPDKTEIEGFYDDNGKHWTSDPLSVDSNGDGILDILEWSEDLAPNGLAPNVDIDGDEIPNLWDEDDDNDGVPDGQDLSPFAHSDYTSSLDLSTEGSGFTGYEYISVQVQPQNTDHLRYSTTALDWPMDDEGNVQDLDLSTDDLRLVPFLLVTTNVQPQAELGEKYGFESWPSGDAYTLLVPLVPIGDAGAVHAFSGKVAYAPGQTADIQWQAEMIWMAQMRADHYENWSIGTEMRVLHQYKDSFRLTGLDVTKDGGYEAAVLGTPLYEEDLRLFRLLLGLNDTFKANLRLEGQIDGETALHEIAERFASGSTADMTHTFNVEPTAVEMSGPVQYGHADAALAGIGSDLVPNLLSTWDAYYGNQRCADVEGNPVSCASLIIAFEQSLGAQGLSEIPQTSSGVADLGQIHLNLANIPLITSRGVQMRMYEEGTGGWQVVTPSRLLELVEARYSNTYATALRSLYPGLSVKDLRFISYAAFLWAMSPSYAPVAADGQPLVPEVADETQLAQNRALPSDYEDEIDTAIDFFALGSGLASTVGVGRLFVNAFLGFSGAKSNWDAVGVGLFATSVIASTAMTLVGAFCDSGMDLAICGQEEALKALDTVIGVWNIVTQSQWILDMVIKYGVGVLKNVSTVAMTVSAVGVAISGGVIWASFAMIALTSGDPVTWRVALAEAIVTTIWMIFLFALNFIPIIGQIISAILTLIDMILGLFTGLFTDKTWSIATAILNLFYDAEVCTSLKDAAFGELSTGLSNPDGGMVGGNTLLLNLPATGIIQKEKEGTNDDLRDSWVEGRMTWEWPAYDQSIMFTATDMTEDPDCEIVGTELHCSNTATLGYALTPRINGLVTFAGRINWQYVWAETALYDAFRWATHTEQATLPEDADKLAPNKMYIDVLPATMDQLWTWSALTNSDEDGDGLSNAQEVTLGTDPFKWDSDGDGLSDQYEWLTSAERGADPTQADTDGDGLNDGLEWRLGTRIDVVDTDGDGLSDGEEVRRLEGEDMVGGWQLTLPSGRDAWVSSDPLEPDSDSDGLNDAEEKAHGLGPQAINSPVPSLSLSVTPIRGIAGGRMGAFWETLDTVEITAKLSNFSRDPVTTTLTLELPTGLVDVQGGTMQGDRTVTPGIGSWGGEVRQFTWTFTGADKLQVYEEVSATITARVGTTSAQDEVTVSMPFGELQLHKAVNVVVDGNDPDVVILAPADGTYLRGESYVVGGSATDPTTWVAEAELSIVTQGSEANYVPLSGSLSPWAYSWSLPTSDGIYSLQARATDAMGHQSTTDAVAVTVDNTPPSASLNATMDGDTVHLSGTASDNLAGVEWVQVAIDGQPWHSVSLDGSVWSCDWTVGESAQGQHSVSLRVVDRSGNVGDILTQEITVDRVAPSSIVNRGADPDTPPAVRPNTTFTLAGVADEGGHLPLPAVPADLRTGMDVYSDSTVWLGLASIAENDGGVLAAWIGDLDGDRLADLAVGLPGPEGDAGEVAVLYGRAGGWPTPPDLEMLASAHTRYVGASGARLGSYVSAAGDTNGDHFSDLLIGERASTRAFLIFGNPHWLGEITLDAGQSAYRTLLQAPDTIQGLSSAGDVDGDGYDDLLILAGTTAYLVLGRMGPWPETVDVAAEAVDSSTNVNGALGVGDVDDDQQAEWLTLGNQVVTLHGYEETGTTFASNDSAPRAAALGDVNGDGAADWLYTSGSDRIMIYGAGPSNYTFDSYDGLLAAPGDVDGDGRADILLSDTEGEASLIRQPSGLSPEVFATISGVGGAANAPYAAGADLNADGSADLLLIPSQAAAQDRGFDAPSFEAGFVSPQSLPRGASSATVADEVLRASSANLRSTGADTLYVDDDAVSGVCDGNSPCYTTIQAAVDASDGGGDTIIVYPGVYEGFRVPAGSQYDHLTVQGVSADAVFVEQSATSVDAIYVAADSVRLANLTVRGATSGVVLEDGAGEPPAQGGNETTIDHLLAHSVQYPISMTQGAALSLADSTLVGDGAHPILNVGSGSGSAGSWSNDRGVPSPVSAAIPITGSGALVDAGGSLYALAGGTSSAIYQSTPGTDGALGNWSQPFSLKEPLPTSTGTTVRNQGESLIAGSGPSLYQLHNAYTWPNLGGKANGYIYAVAIAPNGDVYVGGSFTYIGGVTAKHIARWDGSSWHALVQTGAETNPGTDGTAVRALVFDNSGKLYVGGDFTWAGNLHCGYVAGWNVQTATWFPLGLDGCNPEGCWPTYNGVDGPVYALACDAERLYIGGEFYRASDWGEGQGAQGVWSYNLAIWKFGCTPSRGVDCFQGEPQLYTNGRVTSLSVSNGTLYLGGQFTIVGPYPAVSASHVAKVTFDRSHTPGTATWSALGTGLTGVVRDMAIGPQGKLLVAGVSNGQDGVWTWNGTGWSFPAGWSGSDYYAVTTDSVGNIYTTNNQGTVKVRFAGSDVYQPMADYFYFSDSPWSWSQFVFDLCVDADDQLYGTPSGYYHVNGTSHGALSRWKAPNLYRRALPSGSWSQLDYPATTDLMVGANTLVGDGVGNLYGLWGTYANGSQRGGGVLAYYDSSTEAWESRASPPPTVAVRQIVWADGKLYAVGHQPDWPYAWQLCRYDPGTPGSWTSLASPSSDIIPNGTGYAQGLSWAWDGGEYIYMLRGDATSAFSRYCLSSDTWQTLTNPSVSFGISYGPAMARIGNYLYTYATPTGGSTTNLFRYGKVGVSDLRLAVDRTAFVAPETATSFAWTSLPAATGTYIFRADIDSSNAWVGKTGATWSPTPTTGTAQLSWAQADFCAAEDGLYRLGADSALSAGYHQYTALAHVYPGQASCAACDAGEATWGETAFATVREAVESGAARVLVHPGRYPQSFYLVSGVDVIGSGAETTIIEPPAGTSGTLVIAEGVAGSSLARVTLAGSSGWQGFLAEGGAKGLTLTRNIIRDLGTGVRLRGASEVEVVNNTIVDNTDGLVAEGDNPVNVRNTIFAYNSGTGLKYGTDTTSLSNTYNDFWANGKDMDPADVGGGKLFSDPRFRNLGADDLRLAESSPLIDMGAPNDPTLPGGGTRVDIGYAEHNAANFYVSTEYSETGLNDGLVWQVDAFDTIEAALDAAADTLHGLQSALPEGGYSVGVDEGTYSEQVSVPSHVRLVGSGAGTTTIDAGGVGSAVTFDSVIDAEVSGFTLQNAGADGVLINDAANGITVARNVIANNSGHGISLAGKSSASVSFDTIAGNGGAGVYATGSGSWADVRNNVVDGNVYGLQVESGGKIRNDYNLLHNTTNVSGVTAGNNTETDDPAFAASGYYVLTAASPAIDAADPLAEVPLAGGVRADLGYKELIASPLSLVFGPQIDSTVTGNSGAAKVDVGVSYVSDATTPVTATIPSTWQTLTPATSGDPLYYWSMSESQATPGLYRFYSKATDEAGNAEDEGLDAYEGSFVVDGTAPTVTWGAPALPTSTTAAGAWATAQITGSLDTGDGTRDDVARVYFGVSGAATASYPAERDGNTYQAWIDFPATGSYVVVAVAIDEAGNQAQTSASVTVSANSSVATISQPAANSAVNDVDVTVYGTVRFAAAGTGAVAVTVDGATVQATLESPGSVFSAWTAEITLPTGDGTKAVTVKPSLNGTPGTATTTNLTLDTTAPTLSITTPASGSSETQTVAFTGSVSDAGSGLACVEVSMDGGYTWRPAALSGGDWSLDWAVSDPVDYVTHPAQVRAMDAAGNAQVIERPVSVDNVPPTDLPPVTLSQPVGQHLEKGAPLKITWNTPVDGSGAAKVYLMINQTPDGVPIFSPVGTSETVNLWVLGGQYVHLMAEDAAGNQALYHYGPWHVRNMTNATFGERRQSILVDGFIDLAHDEWLASDLMGTDARGDRAQQLYTSWDGLAIYLGWSGAWWTLDGAMWAYLDVATGGSTQSVGGTQVLPIEADLAVVIDSPDSGDLYAWNGSAWALSGSGFAFSQGSTGDSEARIAYSLAADQDVQLVAFALPRESGEGVSMLGDGERGVRLAAADDSGVPWAFFPNTNPLGQDPTEPYNWESPVIGSMNSGQPAARTVTMEVSSPQASGVARCPASTLQYDIMLQNPEPTAISDLSLILTKTQGLSYDSVTGASSAATSDGWALSVPTIAAGASHNIVVGASLASDLSGLTAVTTTFGLSSGSTALTDAPVVASLSHMVDAQAPSVTFDSVPGWAVAAGSHHFTGAANDGQGSGVVSVQVRQAGTPDWQIATGTLAWSAILDTPTSGTFTLEARAVDACGHLGNAVTQVYNIDDTPPVISWTVPQVITSSMVLLSGKTFDPAPADAIVTLVDVQLDSQDSPWQNASTPLAPDGQGDQAWSWAWTTPMDDNVEHSLLARAHDAAGQTAATGWQTTIVDVVAPQLEVTQLVTSAQLPNDDHVSALGNGLAPKAPLRLPEEPSATAYLPFVRLDGSAAMGARPALNATPLPILSGTVADGAGVASMRVRIYDPSGDVSFAGVSPADVNWVYAADLSGWAIGTYRLRVEAVDINGNVRVAGAYLLEATERPIQGLSAVNDGPKFVGQDVILSASVTEGSNVSYAWDLGDGNEASGQTVTHAYAAEGNYTATVTASNNDGTQTATTAVTIWYGATETTLGVSADEVLVGREVILTATVAPVSPATGTSDGTVTFYDGGNLLAENVALAGGEAQFVTSSLAEGLHTFTADYGGSTLWVSSTSSEVGVLVAAPAFTVSKACSAEPVPQEGPALFTVALANTGNVALAISADEDLTDGTNTILAGEPLDIGVGETRTLVASLDGPFEGQATVINTLTAVGAYADQAGNAWDDETKTQQASATCRVGSRVNVLKWTQGLVDPSTGWTLSLWAEADGFGGTLLASSNTAGDPDGILEFDNHNLDKNQTCTLCEEQVNAGWTSFWQVDSNGDGIIDDTDAIVIPYNPNPGTDVGNRCVNLGAGTGINLLSDGGTLLLMVNNAYPGGAPLSSGYWKNWNRCTGGGQQYTADANGGYAAGFWLLDDVLNPNVGGGINWDDMSDDNMTFPIELCAVAVDLLDKREVADPEVVADGDVMASDAAYALASQLLAAQLNFAAGAATCDAALDAALAGGQLLDKYDFGGSGPYLPSKSKDKKIRADYAIALEIAGTLDRYNNGELCSGPAVAFVTPLDGEIVAGEQPLQVSIIDTVPTTQVEFYVDGVSIGMDSTASDGWSIQWDSTSVGDGSHILSATAVNNLGQIGDADVVVNVDNIVDPPSVAITSPEDGKKVGGVSVEIIAEAFSTAGVSQVEFFVDDASVAVDQDGADGWSAAWDLAGVADGMYILSVTAIAADGQTGNHSISALVDNKPDIQVSYALSPSGAWTKPNVTWQATAIVALDQALEGAEVTGIWSDGSTGTGTTAADGTCSIVSADLSKKVSSVNFTVADINLVGYVFEPSGASSVDVPKP